MRKTLVGLINIVVWLNSSLDYNLSMHNLDSNEGKEVMLNKSLTKKEDINEKESREHEG